MPPINTPKLDPSTVYFHAPEGLQQLYTLDELPEIEEEETEWAKTNPYIKSATDATLSAELGASFLAVVASLGCFAQAYNAFIESLAAAVMMRASPRVSHLAKYGKKYRTRKKNINRAWREYQKEANK